MRLSEVLQQQVFKYGAEHASNAYSQRVFTKLRDCHTAALGYHQYRCEDKTCNHEHTQYHSCGDRHCMLCGGLSGIEWLEGKTAELLPTAYYHVVFTLPHELNSVIMGHRTQLFKLLFEASSYTLLKLGADKKYLGGKPGIISVLHTWGQQLSFHPHVHCIVSGGGMDDTGKWVKEKRATSTTLSASGNFLFPKAVMQSIYKAVFLKGLRKLIKTGEVKCDNIEAIITKIGFKKWEVYAKKPFSCPKDVLEYLGRYTHKTAISLSRILAIDTEKQTITFSYKDYRERGKGELYKTMTLSIAEFTRRFEQHILPKRFVRIRHYGYLQNHGRTARLQNLQSQFGIKKSMPKIKLELWVRIIELYGTDIRICPKCKKAKLLLIATVGREKPFENSILRNKASPWIMPE